MKWSATPGSVSAPESTTHLRGLNGIRHPRRSTEVGLSLILVNPESAIPNYTFVKLVVGAWSAVYHFEIPVD